MEKVITDRCHLWLFWFKLHHGYEPKRLWVDREVLALLCRENDGPPPWVYACTFMGIPLEER